MKTGTIIYVGMPVVIGPAYCSAEGYGEAGWVGWIDHLYNMHNPDRMTVVGVYSEQHKRDEAPQEWTVGVRFASGARAHYHLSNLEALGGDAYG